MKNRLADFIIEQRALVLVVLLCLTGVFLYGAKGLTFNFVASGLRPEGYPNIKLNDEVLKTFGGGNQLTIVLQTRDKDDGGAYDDIFNYETLSTIKNIDTDLQNLEKFPGIDRTKIFDLASTKVKEIKVSSFGLQVREMMYPTVPTTQEEIENLRIKVYQSFAYPAVVSFDSKKTMISADFLPGKADYASIFAQLKELRKKYENKNIIVSLNSPAMEWGYVQSFIPKVAMFSGIALLLMMVIVFLCLGSVQAAVIAGLAGVLSAVWGLGFLGFLHFNLDPAVFGLPFFISLIALVNAVFFIKRFAVEMAKAGDAQKAAKTTIAELYGACGATMLIAGIGLALVALAPFPALRPLFLSGLFWAFASFVIVVGFVPALLTYLPVTAKKADEATRLGKFMLGSARWVCGWGKYAVIAVTLLATIWSCTYMKQLTLGISLPGSQVLWPWHRCNTDGFRITFAFGNLFPLIIVAQGNEKGAVSENIPLLRDIMAFCRDLGKTPDRRVLFPLSLLTSLPGRNAGPHQGDPNWTFIPTQDGQVGMLYRSIIGAGGAGAWDKYINLEETAMCLYILCFDKSEKTIQPVMDRIGEYITNQSPFGIRQADKQYTGLDKFIRGLDAMITRPVPLLPEKPQVDKFPTVFYRIGAGPVGIQADVNDCVRLYFFWTLVFAAIAVVVVTALRYGLLSGLFALLPLLFGSGMALVRMVTAKPQPLPLTPETLPFVIIGFGLFAGGVLYMLNRIKVSYAASKSWEQAIAETMCTTGKAVLYVGMLFLVGLMPLMLPFTMHFMPFAVLSSVLIVVALCAMLATMYVVPAFIALFKPKSIGGGGRG